MASSRYFSKRIWGYRLLRTVRTRFLCTEKTKSLENCGKILASSFCVAGVAFATSRAAAAAGGEKGVKPIVSIPRQQYQESESEEEDGSDRRRKRQSADTKRKRCRACADDGFLENALAVMSATGSSSTSSKKECPPNSAVLGRATWTYLHSLAAYYPDEPSKEQISKMNRWIDICWHWKEAPIVQTLTYPFIYTFSETYPCEYCAHHMQEYLKQNPPRVKSRSEFSQWMCKMHNEVNSRLGKAQFDCAKVDERWLDGPSDGSCD